MHETDLHLEPNEASDLCPVFGPDVLSRRGWDRAFLTVLDEAPAEGSMAVLAHDRDCGQDEGWQAIRLKATATAYPKRTEDAEACARRHGQIYLLGSQFGSKAGPLEPRRSWIARTRESSLAQALDGGRARLEVARLRFGLHRAVNDLLQATAVELLELGPRTRSAYIEATVAQGAEQGKRWAGRVTADDHPINVEGAGFRADGHLVLGLRYPVTADGHPLLVEVSDVEALFDDPDALPHCSRVWVLENVGSRAEPAGIRALHSEGDDHFDAVVGDLDAAGKSSTVLEDHPQGATARSLHVRFTLPPTAWGGTVTAQSVHDFGDVRRVEGVALGAGGHAHYVIDEEGHVALRTLLIG
jgi:hypothetical protein